VQKVHQLKQLLRTLEHNDETEGVALLKETTLAERVALTIIKERPDLSLTEVYNNAVEVTTILRTESHREIEQAYRETYFRKKLAVQPVIEDEPQLQMVVLADEWDLSKIPPLKDEEYLVNDPLAVNYVIKSQLPEEWKELRAQKRETEKRNVTRRAAKFQQIHGHLFRVKRPPARPNQLLGVPTYRRVLSAPQKEAIRKQVHDLSGHPPARPNQRTVLVAEHDEGDP
jgi:hypothetical protein